MTTEIKFTPQQISWIVNEIGNAYIQGIKDSIATIQAVNNNTFSEINNAKNNVMQSAYEQLKKMEISALIPNETKDIKLNGVSE